MSRGGRRSSLFQWSMLYGADFPPEAFANSPRALRTKPFSARRAAGADIALIAWQPMTAQPRNFRRKKLA